MCIFWLAADDVDDRMPGSRVPGTMIKTYVLELTVLDPHDTGSARYVATQPGASHSLDPMAITGGAGASYSAGTAMAVPIF